MRPEDCRPPGQAATRGTVVVCERACDETAGRLLIGPVVSGGVGGWLMSVPRLTQEKDFRQAFDSGDTQLLGMH